MASIDHAEPGDEGVTQGASRAIDDQEAAARNAQRTGGKRKGQERNRRRKHGGKKHGEDAVMLHPSDDPPQKTRRHIAAQCRFASSAPEVPSGVSAHKAAERWPSRQAAKDLHRAPPARAAADQCYRAEAKE